MCSHSVIAAHLRLAEFLACLHAGALDGARELGESAFAAGIPLAENPFRNLPLIHPLREIWTHHWELACSAPSAQASA